MTSCQRSFFGVLSHIINPLLAKLVLSRWLDIGLVLFFACLEVEVHKHAKKRTWPISSHLDRTSLVNNPYLSYDPYGPARAFIAKLLRKSPYEGRTR